MNTESNPIDDVERLFARFVAWPNEHTAPVVALWVAHTFGFPHFYASPRLIIQSATPSSGKTRVLELLSAVCYDAIMMESPTPATIFRRLGLATDKSKDAAFTILFDEVDTIFRGSGEPSEDLRGLINAGYKRGSIRPRCHPKDPTKVLDYRTFAPVAMAGIKNGAMPDTIKTRSIEIMMRKRGGVDLEDFDGEDVELAGKVIREDLRAWMDSVLSTIDKRPHLPEGVRDRAAELWRPLIAIADAAGGDWPKRARAACAYFVLDPANTGDLPWQTELLRDIRTIFRRRNADKLPTKVVLEDLISNDDWRWQEFFGGKVITARWLGNKLRDLEVISKNARYVCDCNPAERIDEEFHLDGHVLKSYHVNRPAGQGGLQEAWDLHLEGVPDEDAM